VPLPAATIRAEIIQAQGAILAWFVQASVSIAALHNTRRMSPGVIIYSKQKRGNFSATGNCCLQIREFIEVFARGCVTEVGTGVPRGSAKRNVVDGLEI
jgi:hypothetical protein